jgi:hypothetical protein
MSTWYLDVDTLEGYDYHTYWRDSLRDVRELLKECEYSHNEWDEIVSKIICIYHRTLQARRSSSNNDFIAIPITPEEDAFFKTLDEELVDTIREAIETLYMDYTCNRDENGVPLEDLNDNHIDCYLDWRNPER